MTVADLIRELQRMPNQGAPVRVVTSGYWGSDPAHADYITPSLADATDVDEVRHIGTWVLVRGL